MPNAPSPLRYSPADDPGLLVSPAHLDWLVGLVDQGLCLALGQQRYRLRLSQAALARHMGMSPGSGTLSRRLRELADAGVVLSRRPLVFHIPVSDPDSRTGAPPTRPAMQTEGQPASHVASASSDSQVATLLVLCSEAMATRSDDIVLAALGCLNLALSARGSGADRARISHESSSNFSNSTSAPESGAEYPTPASLAPVAVVTAGSHLDAPRTAEVLHAIEPLLIACRRLGLPGVTNPHGLLAAVSNTALDDLHQGACMIAEQLSQNVPLRSPVGVLIALARRGELAGLSEFALRPPVQQLPLDRALPTSSEPASLPDVTDPWWEELSRLEREDPAALCHITGDSEPWMAKIRAYPRTVRAAASGPGGVVPDGDGDAIVNPSPSGSECRTSFATQSVWSSVRP